LRFAKAAGIMFLADNVGMTFDQIASAWSSLNADSASFDQYFDQYFDGPRMLRDYSFLVVPDPTTIRQMLLVGTKVGDPELARRMIADIGDMLFGPTGLAFTEADDYAYMRVR
ncbi:MAG: hypothetical protein FWH52_05760, partial [Synergistaceae bacterium]|nr:hypothetical protein [Synergistaceae bacterium]